MTRILCSWIGGADWDSLAPNEEEPGPINRTVEDPHWNTVDEIHLLNNYERKADEFKKALLGKTKAKIVCKDVKLSSPTNFEEVEKAASQLLKTLPASAELILLCSPGTWVMSSCFVLQQHNAYPKARLLEASKEAGVVEIKVPFDISVPYIIERIDAERRALTGNRRDYVLEFEDIKHDCQSMRDAIERANQLAHRSISVLIEGESGSGRNLLAHCIHRKNNPSISNFHTINCSAYSDDQLERELFGHTRDGTPRGERSRPYGLLQKNKDSTLFIEEVDALPAHLQTRLLHAIADSRKKGRSFRFIFSSTRSLTEAVADGSFRTDLFYQIAEDVIWLPPLRDRGVEDLRLITDDLMRKHKEALKNERDHIRETVLDSKARDALNTFPFKGNVRELSNVLVRAIVHSKTPIISKQDIEDALGVTRVGTLSDDLLNRPLDEDFVLDEVLDQVSRHYFERAKLIKKSKRQAAKVLGFKNYQTLANRIEKLEGFDW